MRLPLLLFSLFLTLPVQAQGNCSDGTTGVIVSVSRAEISPDGSLFQICFAVEGNPAESLRYLFADGFYNGSGLEPLYSSFPGNPPFPGPGYDISASWCLGGPDKCPVFGLHIDRDPDEPPYLAFPVEPAEFICIPYHIRDPSERAGVVIHFVYAEQGDRSPASVCPVEDQANYDGPLPVELVALDAVADGQDVNLTWETASETNNAGFEVQMLTGESWNALGWVEGHGTTTEAQTYVFSAEGMDVGTHTFRLKQIDFDGAFEYSDDLEVAIETPGSHVLSAAYPNPFNPQSNFTLSVAQDQQVTADLFNTLGQRVAVLFSGTVDANQTQLVTIDGAGLASGMYVVRVNGERFNDALSVTLPK